MVVRGERQTINPAWNNDKRTSFYRPWQSDYRRYLLADRNSTSSNTLSLNAANLFLHSPESILPRRDDSPGKRTTLITFCEIMLNFSRFYRSCNLISCFFPLNAINNPLISIEQVNNVCIFNIVENIHTLHYKKIHLIWKFLLKACDKFIHRNLLLLKLSTFALSCIIIKFFERTKKYWNFTLVDFIFLKWHIYDPLCSRYS